MIEIEMSKTIRHRHQRQRLYRVACLYGTCAAISAAQFIAGIAAGNLIRDPSDKHLARVPNRLTITVIFRSTGIPRQPPP